MPTAEQASSTSLDLSWVRSQFPSLAQTVNGHLRSSWTPRRHAVPQRVIDAISDYLPSTMPTPAAPTRTSRTPDRMIAEAARRHGRFSKLRCGRDRDRSDMTTLTYAMFARDWARAGAG